MLLKNIYKKSEDELKKFWLMNVYSNENINLPTTVSSAKATIKYVEQIEGAIGVLKATEVPQDKVKILKIDGKLPEDKDYELKL
jgi:hypothetical protein